jgi:hypothetical protein
MCFFVLFAFPDQIAVDGRRPVADDLGILFLLRFFVLDKNISF